MPALSLSNLLARTHTNPPAHTQAKGVWVDVGMLCLWDWVKRRRRRMSVAVAVAGRATRVARET